MIGAALESVFAGRDLTFDQARAVMDQIMTGQCQPAQFGAFMTALTLKGETADELAGMADSMRCAALTLELEGDDHVDTCGTGGDGKNTFNVSTAAAFVTAGAGVVVAKHGNRAASSAAGSADVLEALGARITLTPQQVKSCIAQSGIGFMFAQSFHPAMKFAGPLRAQLPIRTVFNILGPLTNPAAAKRQVLGVARRDLADLVAGALLRLGSRRALVVCGLEGLDEISIAGPSLVLQVEDGQITRRTVRPADFGLAEHPLETVGGGDPAHNARIITSVLSGRAGPARDFVLLNAAAALVAGGRADELAGALEIAADSVDSGRARSTLDRFIAATRTA